MSAPVYAEFEAIQKEGKAKCKHCSSMISGSTKITSNFLTHLKRKHREVYLSLTTATSTSPSKVKVEQTPSLLIMILVKIKSQIHCSSL